MTSDSQLVQEREKQGEKGKPNILYFGDVSLHLK
jgi:hypothetical protein